MLRHTEKKLLHLVLESASLFDVLEEVVQWNRGYTEKGAENPQPFVIGNGPHLEIGLTNGHDVGNGKIMLSKSKVSRHGSPRLITEDVIKKVKEMRANKQTWKVISKRLGFAANSLSHAVDRAAAEVSAR